MFMRKLCEVIFQLEGEEEAGSRGCENNDDEWDEE
jgi:hypothetical protein